MSELKAAAAMRIAVVGMAGRFPGSPCVDAFWRNLRSGTETITHFSPAELRAAGVPEELRGDPAYVPARGILADADRFDATRFRMRPTEAELTDPQHRVFLECALTALEDAGYGGGAKELLIGVFAGCGASRYAAAPSAPPTGTRPTVSDYQLAIANEKDFLAARVSYHLDLRGPSLTVGSACSSSLVAVALACQSLLTYQCDVALAGGVSIGLPLLGGYLYQAGMVLSPDGHCRAFDAAAAGTVPGDGAGAVVLRRLEDALADGDSIYAVLCGYGLTNDGADKLSFTAPSVSGQAAAVAQALAMAEFTPQSISYVEAHGTGTALGDPIEVAALARVFQSGGPGLPATCALGSVKTNIGHLDAAAGIAGLIKVIQMLRHRELPPSLHFQRENPRLNLAATPFCINATLRAWESVGPLRAGVSSFGIGGANAHVVLEQAPPPPVMQASERPQLLTLSASSAQALAAAEGALQQHLVQHPELPLADVAFTLAVGRSAERHRIGVACANRAEASSALARAAANLDQEPIGSPVPEVVFLFPGHGSGYPAMGRALYDGWPAFRADIDHGVALLHSTTGVDLRPVLFAKKAEHVAAAAMLSHSAVGQPAIFLIEWAVSRLLFSWGVRPQALIGHSLGEYAAACLAGVMSLADGLRLVAQRGAFIAGTPEGAMLAVGLSPAALAPLLGYGLELAAVNGPTSCVVAGCIAAISALEQRAAEQGIPARRLAATRAFHSSLMDEIIEPFAEAVGRTTLGAPQFPLLSAVTADWLTAAEATDPQYWARHLRLPVRFAEALDRLDASRPRLFLEIGPGNTLTNLVRCRHGVRAQDALTTLGSPVAFRDEGAQLLEAVGRLWQRGVEVELHRLHEGERRHRVRLPTYPFERQRYFLPESRVATAPRSSLRPPPSDPGAWLYAPVWRSAPRPQALAEAQRFILLGDCCGLAGSLAARLGPATVQVLRGERFECLAARTFSIDPQRREHYTELLQAATEGPPYHIVHGFSMAAEADPGSIEEALALGHFSVMALMQALGAHSARGGHVTLLTAGAQAVAGRPSHPAAASLAALLRVLPEEYPALGFSGIDLSPEELAEPELVPLLATELASLARENVALRRGERLLCHYAAIPASSGRQPTLKQGGVYLLTGGLGGIGISLAEHLFFRYRARLILVGRSGLVPQAEWPALLARPREDEARRRLERYLVLRAAGAELLVQAADVSDFHQMRSLVERAQSQFGGLDGVIHAAGVTGGGAVQRRSQAQAREILLPKIQGTLVLAAVLHDVPIDFLLLCSSLTALTGGFGQADYAAANAFLDAFAERANRPEDRRVISVNWDGWQEIGSAARAGQCQSGTERPRYASQISPAASLAGYLTPSEGSEVFELALAVNHARIIVSKGELQPRLQGSSTGDAGLPDLAPAPAHRPLHSRPELAVPLVLPSNATEVAIARVWSQQLGIAALGVDDDFFALGGDSLLAVQAAQVLQTALKLQVPSHLLLENPTVARLARRLALEGGSGEPSRRMVLLAKGPADRAPLFLFHPVGGHVYFYLPLAQGLSQVAPIYGITAQGIDGEAPPLATVEEMAVSYARAVRTVQREGPYRLGGSSFGGLTAFATAHELARAGQRVELLALIDSPGLQAMPPALGEDAEILAYLLGRGGNRDSHLACLSGRSEDEMLHYFLRHGAQGERLPPDTTVYGLRHFLRLFRAHYAAMVHYQPKRWQGPLLFFSATESDGLHAAGLDRAWTPLCDSIEVVATPGNHLTINLQPNVDVIVQRLRKALSSSLDNNGVT